MKTMTISKYDVMLGIFEADDEENEAMLIELTKMINVFCREEVRTVSNVTSMSFDIDTFKTAIEYLNSKSLAYAH